MRQLLCTLPSKGENYTVHVYRNDDGSCEFTADFDVDIDGSPRWHEDPWGQPETTLRHNGKSINADEVPGIVLPPECLLAVKEIVMGCQAEATYNGRTEPAVVFDQGPSRKFGEGSRKLANLLGIDPSPINGGVDDPLVTYKWWPGVPAVVDGITYKLQATRT